MYFVPTGSVFVIASPFASYSTGFSGRTLEGTGDGAACHIHDLNVALLKLIHKKCELDAIGSGRPQRLENDEKCSTVSGII